MFLYIKLVHHYFIIILTYNHILEKIFCLLRITITYIYFVIIIRAFFYTHKIRINISPIFTAKVTVT